MFACKDFGGEVQAVTCPTGAGKLSYPLLPAPGQHAMPTLGEGCASWGK